MPTLLEKIETNAAQRLPLPPQRQPAQELARYKNFLRLETHRLKMLHRAGAGGKEICQARAATIDLLLCYLLKAVQKTISDPPLEEPPIALVALGGYGRAELSPFSDIDFMFLHNGDLVSRGKAGPYLSALTDGFLYTLWDIGLKVGHSVRSIDDCVKEANSNMQSKTALIEARLVTGDESLFNKMRARVLAECVNGYEKEYITARIQDQNARRAKYGDSACMQEPNIKNGCGGLRDYQNLVWMAYFKYRARSLPELQARELISNSELKQLESAYDFLLRVRNELHYQVTRPVDVISKNLQPAIAYSLGFTERSPRKRIEQFMKQLYTHLRNIFLITRTVEQRLALLPQPNKLPSLREFFRSRRRRATQQWVDGFKIVEGEIHPGSARVFRDQPRRLMRVFLHAQQRGLKLHPDLTQLMRNQLSLVDREFLRDEHVRETFLELLNQRGNVGGILRTMHEIGFLGKYIPEFSKLTCLVQHEFYHRYTADEHTLMCIEQLDRVWEAEKSPYNNYTELFQNLERPFILYLALLLHDAGKAFPSRDHSEISRRVALAVAKRLELDGATTHTLCLVIEHHLTMVLISQRRDLDDPDVIRHFAAQIQSPENLAILTLHTFADSMGTSEELWNGFKDSLLWTLYDKTLKVFTHGADFIRAEEKQRELLAQEVRQMIPRNLSPEEVEAHFHTLPPRYFLTQSARQIVSHIGLAHCFMHLQFEEIDRALEPVLHWHHEHDRGYTTVTICTWDRPGVFSNIAGSLAASGLNILSAQGYTRADGIVLDTFYVTDAKTGKLANRQEKDKFERVLSSALTGKADLRALILRQKPSAPAYKTWPAESIPTVIHFDNDSSHQYTVLEVETDDRVGLLYFLSRTLADLNINIVLAKISTEKGAAIDSFYIEKTGGGKIVEPELQSQIEARLREALHALEAAQKD